MITDMLTNVIDEGTARAARGMLKLSALAGKTGTSRDGWFAGYTPNLVCVVWVGFDDNRQLGLTGAESALPVWAEFVKGAVELRPELGGAAFMRPDGITAVDIDPETGYLAAPDCPQRERIAVTPALAPVAECFTHQPSFVASLASNDSVMTNETGAELTATHAAAAPDVVATTRANSPRGAAATTVTLALPSSQTTQVEHNGDGRARLTNGLRIAAEQSQRR